MRLFPVPITLVVVLLIAAGCSAAEPTSTPVVSVLPETNPTESPNSPTEEPVLPEKNTPSPQPTETALAYSQLIGLPIQEFFEEAYFLILARDPERLVELGLDNPTADQPVLTSFSPEDIADSHQLKKDLLALLHQYEYETLSPADQISYQIFEDYLLNEIQLYQFSKYENLVTPLSIRSWPQLFIMFFTESHPLSTPDEAQAYVTRVQLLDEKMDQLVARLELQVQAGVIPPRLVIELGRANMKNFFGSTYRSSPLLTNFLNKTAKIPDLDADHRNALVEELSDALNTQVYPAYQRLDGYLSSLQVEAPEVIGLLSYEGGLDYYQFLLGYFTTSDLSANEIHALGMKELERIHLEISQKFTELGYPDDENLPLLYQRMIEESGNLIGGEITKEYERILQTADEQLEEYFELRPEGQLEVVGGDQGAFYSSGSLDGSRPGMFYARTNAPQPVYQLKTIAYHEGIPGHHYQISLAIQSDLPLFRNLLIFDGYAEGWALYAEYLASELGWYSDDPYGDLGRLQYEALRACRMIVDTGIHAKGWSYDQAVDFIVQNTGISKGFAEWEVIRYISYPGQAPAYMVGKIEILRLREVAREALGDTFDLRAFHRVVLENGSMPLTTLEEVILNWIEKN